MHRRADRGEAERPRRTLGHRRGASSSDVAVREAAGGVEAVPVMATRNAPVRAAIELGGRIGILAGEDWKILTARLAVHY